jgi:hypothetical protein
MILFRFWGNYFRTWGALRLWLSIVLIYRFVCRVFYRGLANLGAFRWCLISKQLYGLIPSISPQPFQRVGSVNIRYHNLMRALTSNY